MKNRLNHQDTKRTKTTNEGNTTLTSTLTVDHQSRFDSIQEAAIGTTLDSTGAPVGFFSGDE